MAEKYVRELYSSIICKSITPLNALCFFKFLLYCLTFSNFISIKMLFNSYSTTFLNTDLRCNALNLEHCFVFIFASLVLTLHVLMMLIPNRKWKTISLWKQYNFVTAVVCMFWSVKSFQKFALIKNLGTGNDEFL